MRCKALLNLCQLQFDSAGLRCMLIVWKMSAPTPAPLQGPTPTAGVSRSVAATQRPATPAPAGVKTLATSNMVQDLVVQPCSMLDYQCSDLYTAHHFLELVLTKHFRCNLGIPCISHLHLQELHRTGGSHSCCIASNALTTGPQTPQDLFEAPAPSA